MGKLCLTNLVVFYSRVTVDDGRMISSTWTCARPSPGSCFLSLCCRLCQKSSAWGNSNPAQCREQLPDATEKDLALPGGWQPWERGSGEVVGAHSWGSKGQDKSQ